MELNKNKSYKQDIDHSKELLIADYKYLCDSFRENEQIGERRIKFFITLVTAVLAACATLITSNNGFINTKEDYERLVIAVIFFSLFFLLVIGIITLLRMIQRNRVTDGYKRDLDEIRQRFKDYFDKNNALEDYAPFGAQIVRTVYSQNNNIEIESNSGRIKLRRFGGLTHTTAAMNSLILAGIVGGLLLGDKLWLTIVSIILVFVSSFVVQYLYINNSSKRNKELLHKYDFTHAGGVVVRLKENKPEFLIVTAKENRNHYVLPKGHIEQGEEHRTTAIREVLEESGILAQPKRPVGSICFLLNNKDTRKEEFIRSKFYLMEYLEELEEKKEGRIIRWCDYKEAINLLSFEDSKSLLAQTRSILESEFV